MYPNVYSAWGDILEGEAKKVFQGLTLKMKESFRERCVKGLF